MALNDLLARLESRSVTPVTPQKMPDVTPRPAPILACTPVTPVTSQKCVMADKPDSDRLPDATMEARRQHVLAMLDEKPASRYAVLVEYPNTDPVIVTVGIRGVATLEVSIPAAQFDSFTLLELIGRHGGETIH